MTSSKSKTLDLVYISLFAVLIAVCSWISIPMTAPFVPFTLQTFGIFLTVGLLGGKRGTIAVLIYILLGAVGIPVFSGFRGGLGVLLGTTGGYIAGFLFSALVMWTMEALLGKKKWVFPCSMLLGLLVCYAFGTVWYIAVYTKTGQAAAVGTVLGWCVMPFIIPDLIKMGAALLIRKRLLPWLSL